jgi:hypothetical protein
MKDSSSKHDVFLLVRIICSSLKHKVSLKKNKKREFLTASIFYVRLMMKAVSCDYACCKCMGIAARPTVSAWCVTACTAASITACTACTAWG